MVWDIGGEGAWKSYTNRDCVIIVVDSTDWEFL